MIEFWEYDTFFHEEHDCWSSLTGSKRERLLLMSPATLKNWIGHSLTLDIWRNFLSKVMQSNTINNNIFVITGRETTIY